MRDKQDLCFGNNKNTHIGEHGHLRSYGFALLENQKHTNIYSVGNRKPLTFANFPFEKHISLDYMLNTLKIILVLT